MTIRQSFNKTIYPILKMGGKWLKYKGKYVMNQKNALPVIPVYSLNACASQGLQVSFHDYKGKFVLIANTASQCGYTAQYAELQQLQEKFADRLMVLGFPSNDFGEQEPGDDQEISSFCQVNFGVKFPLMQKSVVTGPGKNPVYQWLTNPALNGWNSNAPSWNFCKYLIGPDGRLLGFFESAVSPLSEEIEALLAK